MLFKVRLQVSAAKNEHQRLCLRKDDAENRKQDANIYSTWEHEYPVLSVNSKLGISKLKVEWFFKVTSIYILGKGCFLLPSAASCRAARPECVLRESDVAVTEAAVIL